jgi:predicted  nucleic acid-binding Zn-ribbon protein
MDRGDMKRYLWRYQDAKKDKRRLEEELEELKEQQEHTGAIHYSDMPKGSTDLSDLSDYMVKREQITNKILSERMHCIQIFQEIKECVESLPNAAMREIFTLRYIRGMKWAPISEWIGKEWAQMHRIHDDGLDYLIDKLNCKNIQENIENYENDIE